MSCVKKCRGCVHELFFPIADLAGVQFVAFTDDGQCILLFEDFQHNFELEVGGKFALGLAFHTGLNLARYPTYRVVLNMGRTISIGLPVPKKDSLAGGCGGGAVRDLCGRGSSSVSLH